MALCIRRPMMNVIAERRNIASNRGSVMCICFSSMPNFPKTTGNAKTLINISQAVLPFLHFGTKSSASAIVTRLRMQPEKNTIQAVDHESIQKTSESLGDMTDRPHTPNKKGDAPTHRIVTKVQKTLLMVFIN